MADLCTPTAYAVPEGSNASGSGPSRTSSSSQAAYAPLPSLSEPFELNDSVTRNYKAQYANVYYTRLKSLRAIVAERARQKWAHVKGNPHQLERILKVERSKLCFIVGTVYMDMPLKPNVLEDMGRDHWVAPPPPRPKYYSAKDVVTLEDESGRIILVGDRIKKETERPDGGLVTGVVMAALGMETASGDFEVIDVCFAGAPSLAAHSSKSRPLGTKAVVPQPQLQSKGKGKALEEDVDMEDAPPASLNGNQCPPVWVALVSGVTAGSSDVPEDLKSILLTEWLTGEAGGQDDVMDGSRIAHVVFAGDSLAPPIRNEDDRKPRRYGYDASQYTAHPTQTLDAMLLDLLASGLSVHILPGAADPVGVTLPQRPFPRAMLRNSSMAGGDALKMHTNPCWFELGGKSFLGTGGQTIDDIYKYVHSDDRLSMAKRTLDWRHLAPTAPDTLWCYPFADKDPFVLERRPHVYVVGNQPEFVTGLVEEGEAEPTRVILLPKFCETGMIALVDIASPTLECRTVQIGVPEWEIEKIKVTMTEEEIEQARERAAVVRSDLDLLADGDDW